MLSVSFAIVAGLTAWQTHGLARALCLVVAAVVALPAVATSGFALLAVALTALAGPAQSAEDRKRPGNDAWRVIRRRRTRLACLVVALLSGAAGATWYAISPGVASYQVSVPLMLPALAIVLIWAQRRLPRPLHWPLALVLAPIGPLGYLFIGGAQWWSWGQLTLLPLILLAGRGAVSSESADRSRYRAFGDGPWGPP
jgi:hypothetical protein